MEFSAVDRLRIPPKTFDAEKDVSTFSWLLSDYLLLLQIFSGVV